jgi:hypothetical protein
VIELLAFAAAPLTAASVIPSIVENVAGSTTDIVTGRIGRLDSGRVIAGLSFSTDLAGTFALPTEAVSQDQPTQDLFGAAPAALAAPDRVLDPTVVRARRVTVNSAMLPDASNQAPNRGARLRLNLFDDVVLAASLDRLDRTEGGFVWVGHVDGVPMSSVTVSSHDSVIGGIVFSANGVYTIRFLGGQIYEIAQIDQSRFPREAPPRTTPPHEGRSAIPTAPRQEQNN